MGLRFLAIVLVCFGSSRAALSADSFSLSPLLKKAGEKAVGGRLEEIFTQAGKAAFKRYVLSADFKLTDIKVSPVFKSGNLSRLAAHLQGTRNGKPVDLQFAMDFIYDGNGMPAALSAEAKQNGVLFRSQEFPIADEINGLVRIFAPIYEAASELFGDQDVSYSSLSFAEKLAFKAKLTASLTSSFADVLQDEDSRRELKRIRESLTEKVKAAVSGLRPTLGGASKAGSSLAIPLKFDQKKVQADLEETVKLLLVLAAVFVALIILAVFLMGFLAGLCAVVPGVAFSALMLLDVVVSLIEIALR